MAKAQADASQPAQPAEAAGSEQASPEAAPFEDFEPVDVFELGDLNQLRAAATPLRIQILRCLQEEARTVQEVGRMLGDNSTRLYYHVNELERAGLVRLVGTVHRSGTVEKHYRAIAHYFRLPPALLQSEGHSLEGKAWVEFITGAVEAATRDLRRSYRKGLVQRHPETLDVRHQVANLPPEAARALATILRNLGQLFVHMHRDSEPVRFGLLLALYPESEEAGPGAG